ncbi:MAG: glycerol kinase GlpK [Candidatus Azotimanducaceae bacterium]|nr:glycerol kinase [Gammaproteobacteria bacterium]OUV68818.1 MAG: glycerol kinase [Gammaproteobacteria bacterium TMED133]
MATNILALDQGTSSTRAVVFNETCAILDMAQKEITQFFPKDGWVEHDPEEIWTSSLEVIKSVVDFTGSILAIGITNQRETTIVWDLKTGEPIYPAIVWQDRRTADYCDVLRRQGFESTVTSKTGLLLDPYFSATKLKWILDHVEGARDKARKGCLLFGTVDSFLLWRLTKGRSHKTDATNASRTMLFNIHQQVWDKELLELFDIPLQMLPEVCDCSSFFGSTSFFGGEIPITGIAGDQQSSLIGQCCFYPGMLKSTYGTGCFAILNTGKKPVRSNNKLLTTVGYRLNGEVTYALEGSIFIAGAAVQWLRDGLGLIKDADSTEGIAKSNPDTGGVYLVPAFTGLGAPYWDARARGAVLGLTRDTKSEDLVTATLQSVCFQTRDLLSAMHHDRAELSVIRVDGGMATNNWVVQQLADITQMPVDRPVVVETTSLGAAFLAGLQVGIFKSLRDLESCWRKDRRFFVELDRSRSDKLYAGWQEAVSRVRTT